MVTGKRKEDYAFYEGYEGEQELELYIDEESLHIWDGYMEDIFGSPIQVGDVWKGFTRDYNEFTGVYADDSMGYLLEVKEYMEDASRYKEAKFEYEESISVLEKIIGWLSEQEKAGRQVMARVI